MQHVARNDDGAGPPCEDALRQAISTVVLELGATSSKAARRRMVAPPAPATYAGVEMTMGVFSNPSAFTEPIGTPSSSYTSSTPSSAMLVSNRAAGSAMPRTYPSASSSTLMPPPTLRATKSAPTIEVTAIEGTACPARLTTRPQTQSALRIKSDSYLLQLQHLDTHYENRESSSLSRPGRLLSPGVRPPNPHPVKRRRLSGDEAYVFGEHYPQAAHSQDYDMHPSVLASNPGSPMNITFTASERPPIPPTSAISKSKSISYHASHPPAVKPSLARKGSSKLKPFEHSDWTRLKASFSHAIAIYEDGDPSSALSALQHVLSECTRCWIDIPDPALLILRGCTSNSGSDKVRPGPSRPKLQSISRLSHTSLPRLNPSDKASYGATRQPVFTSQPHASRHASGSASGSGAGSGPGSRPGSGLSKEKEKDKDNHKGKQKDQNQERDLRMMPPPPPPPTVTAIESQDQNQIDHDTPPAFHELFGRSLFAYGALLDSKSSSSSSKAMPNESVPKPASEPETYYRAALDIFSAGEVVAGRRFDMMGMGGGTMDWRAAITRGRAFARLAISVTQSRRGRPSTPERPTSTSQPSLAKLPTLSALQTVLLAHRLSFTSSLSLSYLPSPPPSTSSSSLYTPSSSSALATLAVDHLMSAIVQVPRDVAVRSRVRLLWEVGKDMLGLAEMRDEDMHRGGEEESVGDGEGQDGGQETCGKARLERARWADGFLRQAQGLLEAVDAARKGKGKGAVVPRSDVRMDGSTESILKPDSDSDSDSDSILKSKRDPTLADILISRGRCALIIGQALSQVQFHSASRPSHSQAFDHDHGAVLARILDARRALEAAVTFFERAKHVREARSSPPLNVEDHRQRQRRHDHMAVRHSHLVRDQHEPGAGEMLGQLSNGPGVLEGLALHSIHPNHTNYPDGGGTENATGLDALPDAKLGEACAALAKLLLVESVATPTPKVIQAQARARAQTRIRVQQQEDPIERTVLV